MVAVGRRMYERGLVGGSEGNVTCRLGPHRLLATPSRLCKGDLKPSDCVVIDLNGNPLEGGRPSSEIRMHLRIYKHRDDCEAVVHAHPVYATALSLVGDTIPSDLLYETAFFLGPVALVPFGTPGTDELPNAIEPYLAGHKTLLLMNHGATVLGNSLWDALHRMDTLDRVAKIVLAARQIGTPRPMPNDLSEAWQEALMHGRLDVE